MPSAVFFFYLEYSVFIRRNIDNHIHFTCLKICGNMRLTYVRVNTEECDLHSIDFQLFLEYIYKQIELLYHILCYERNYIKTNKNYPSWCCCLQTDHFIQPGVTFPFDKT